MDKLIRAGLLEEVGASGSLPVWRGKFLARNAGIGDAKQPMPNNSERFVITINLGADVEKYDKSIKIDANDTPEAVALKAITAPDGN